MAQIDKQTKCSNMLLTRNNPSKDAETWLREMHEGTNATYTVGQLEMGEQEGVPHIQAFINFKTQQRFSRIHKVDPKTACKEVRINNGAHKYCMKEQTRLSGPWEFGTLPFQRNNKTDWADVKLKAKTKRIEEISPDVYVRHYANLKKIEKDNLQVIDKTELRGIWIHGPAGIGKSKFAREFIKQKGGSELTTYNKPRNEWWDGYTDQQYVIMEDMDPFHVNLGGKLKDWADRYGFIMGNKGGATTDQYKYFIVTSQYSIEDIFSKQDTKSGNWICDNTTIDALNRRYVKIKFNMDGSIEDTPRSTPTVADIPHGDLINIINKY